MDGFNRDKAMNLLLGDICWSQEVRGSALCWRRQAASIIRLLKQLAGDDHPHNLS